MRWVERPEIVNYVVECYAGLDGRKRQFIWEEGDEVLIGNARAFTDHLTNKFELVVNSGHTAWMEVHWVLRELGEIAEIHSKYSPRTGKNRFKNQEPESRVIKHIHRSR